MSAGRIVVATAAAVVVVLAAALLLAARIRGAEKARTPSPDGRWAAAVRSHWTVDPPAQSLWLGRRGDRLDRVATLGEDMDWCSETVWAEDSGAVAFVVSGSRALVVEPGSRRRPRRVALVPEDDYPSSREARTVRFSADGERLLFRDCARGGGDCRDGEALVGRGGR